MNRLRLAGVALAGCVLFLAASWSLPAAAKAPPAARNPLQKLYDHGVLLHLLTSNDYAANVSGGLQTGDADAGTTLIGADLDMHKLFGIPGAKMHLMYVKSYGSTIQDETGNYIKPQGWYYPFQHGQLAQLTWEQSLFDGRINILAGRTNATGPFARPTYGCKFVNGTQCPFVLPLFDAKFSGFPLVTWGGRVRYNPTPRIYAQAGVYAIDPDRRLGDGTNLGTGSVTGNVVPVEVGYSTNFNNDKYPRHFKLGGWFRDAPTLDPRLNVQGSSRAVVPGPPKMNDDDQTGIYLLADQVIYRPDASHRALAVFASYAQPFQSRQPLASQFSAGLEFQGPFKSRPLDNAGFMVTHLEFSGPQTRYMNDLLARNGSNDSVDSDEYQLELNYGIQLTRGVKLQPNVQYIVNPDITQRPDADSAPDDALVVGVRLSVNLGAMAGLPFRL